MCGLLHWIIPLCVILLLAVSSLAAMIVCFFMIFYSPKRKHPTADEYPIPEGEIYEVHRDKMVEWTKGTRAMNAQDVSVVSFDGLTLRGKYYEQQKGAPIEILFHGYKGTSERLGLPLFCLRP